MSTHQWEDEEMWMSAERQAKGNCNNTNNYNEEDEELLRNVPYANDAVSFLPHRVNNYDSPLKPAPDATAEKPLLQVTSKETPTITMEISKGICTLPPLSQTCFMMHGDNGVVRWLTASGLDKSKVPRKRGREATGMDTQAYPQQHEWRSEEEIEEESNANDDDDDDDDGKEELLSVAEVLRRRRIGTGLGHVNVPALLQQIYEGAADSNRRSQISTHEENKQPQQNEEKMNGSRGNDALWVMKYGPKRFRDLLSDDSTNLKLLQWMKSWDAYIFTTGTTSNDTAVALSTELTSVAKRPDERLAVLVGPPGVGKTTLAHVLAVHCGYEPIEINASVDRTTSALESAIQLAVAPARSRRRVHPLSSSTSSATARTTLASPSSSSSLTASSGAATTRSEEGRGGVSLVEMLLRPKCLIIDEMDGITANVATFLLKQDIHCPVLCLCNDFYTPSLRSLRRQCQHVYYFQPIRPQRLLSRLGEIAQREGLNVSASALAELVQSSNGDVRCCLNTLQFMYRHTSQGMTTTMMHEMQGKDTELGLWETWRTVFVRQDRGRYIQMLRKEHAVDYEAAVMAGIQNTSTGNKTSMENGYPNLQHQQQQDEHVTQGFRVDPGYIYVSRAVQQCAEPRTLCDGLQEYYLQRSYADYSLQRTSAMADAFSFYDHLSTCAYHNATAAATLIPFVDRYAYTTAAACFSYCCSTYARTSAPLGFPRESSTAARQGAESASIARVLREGCRASLAAHLSSIDTLAQEVVPLLLRCLCNASLRIPLHSIVSLTSLNREDQLLLQASIARHAEYGLTYARSSFRLTEARTVTTTSSSSSSSLTLSSFPGGGGGGAAAAEEGGGVDHNGVVEEHWELTPPIHRIGCVSLHTVHTEPTRKVGFTPGAQSNSTFSTTSSSFASTTASTPVMVLRMKDEMKQLMVGEIQRYIIRSKAAHSTTMATRRSMGDKNTNNMNRNNGGILAVFGGKTVDEGGLPVAGRKREREGEEVVGNEDRKADESIGKKGITNITNPISHPEPTTTPNNNIPPMSTSSLSPAAMDTPTTSTTTTTTATTTTTTTKSKSTGKRDFFGRLIPETSTKTAITDSRRPAVGAAGGTAGGVVTGRNASILTVQYTYHDGCTNAVRIPASFEDF